MGDVLGMITIEEVVEKTSTLVLAPSQSTLKPVSQADGHADAAVPLDG